MLTGTELMFVSQKLKKKIFIDSPATKHFTVTLTKATVHCANISLELLNVWGFFNGLRNVQEQFNVAVDFLSFPKASN